MTKVQVSTARLERGCGTVSFVDNVKHDEFFKMGKLHVQMEQVCRKSNMLLAELIDMKQIGLSSSYVTTLP